MFNNSWLMAQGQEMGRRPGPKPDAAAPRACPISTLYSHTSLPQPGRASEKRQVCLLISQIRQPQIHYDVVSFCVRRRTVSYKMNCPQQFSYPEPFSIAICYTW